MGFYGRITVGAVRVAIENLTQSQDESSHVFVALSNDSDRDVVTERRVIPKVGPKPDRCQPHKPLYHTTSTSPLKPRSNIFLASGPHEPPLLPSPLRLSRSGLFIANNDILLPPSQPQRLCHGRGQGSGLYSQPQCRSSRSRHPRSSGAWR